MNNNVATILFIVFVGFVALAIRVMTLSTPSEVPKESEFTVVSKYKDCEFVRFSSRLEARSHYFLHCDK